MNRRPESFQSFTSADVAFIHPSFIGVAMEGAGDDREPGLPRSVNAALGYPRKKTKKKEARYNWVRHYPVTLGIRAVVAATFGKVEQAVCRFCEQIKREGKAASMEELDLILQRNTRKPYSNVAIFATFCKDIIVRHLKTQHPTKWAEYKKLPIDESIRDRFFTDPDASTAILSFIPDQDGFSVVVPGSIVPVIQRLIRQDNTEASSCADPTIALSASAFDGLVERQDGSFSLHVAHGLQFKTIICCISSVTSFRTVVEMFTIFSEAYANGKLGHVTQELVARTARYAVAINLTAMRVIGEHVWGISILVDGASHAAEGYLDVRLAFECKRQLHNSHFIAIPTGEKAHTAANYAELVVDALTNVLGSWILPKVNGIATDGAATMLGCRQGFAKKIRAVCHQLNLVVGAFLKVFDCFANFRSTLGFEIAFTRTHESVSMLLDMCPEYIKTRWNSIHDTCNFLTQCYEDLNKMQSEKGREHSSPTWWLCCL